ncbi:MAG TPA: Ig-like domain-containing protein [Armatimonadota bacterium]|nr:Ig-like domain-containing protein [Armatimonadota bacterium]
MAGSRVHTHAAATFAMIVLAVMTIIGGCTHSAPTVTRTTPAQNASEIDVSPAVVRINFDQPMLRSSVEDSFRITPEVEGPPQFNWQNNQTLEVTFPSGFEPGTTYKIEITTSAESIFEVPLSSPYVLSFNTVGENFAGSLLTFTDDIYPIALVRCSGCHQGPMIDYDRIIAESWVIPDQPLNSPYFTIGAALTKHTGGDAWEESKDIIRQWIETGAPR